MVGGSLAAVALLAALALGGLAFWGPGLVAARGTLALRQAGYPAAVLEVDRLGPAGATGAVTLAEGQGVERFAVSFTPWGLAAGRLDRVEIAGLRLRLSAGPDGLVLVGREVPAAETGGWPARLPFRELALTNALLTLAGPMGEVAVPLQGSLEATAVGFGLDADFTGAGDGPGIAGSVRLRWTGSGPPDGTADLTLRALPLGAGAALDGRIFYEGGTRRLAASLRVPRAAEIAIDGRLDAGVRLIADIADLAPLGRLAGLGLAGQGRVTAETAGAWGVAPPSLKIEASLRGGMVAGLLSGASLAGTATVTRVDAGWRLETAGPLDLSFVAAAGLPLPEGEWRLSWAPGRTAPAELLWRQATDGLQLTASGDLAVAAAGLSGGISLKPSELVLDNSGLRGARLAIVDGALSAGGTVPSGHALRVSAVYDRAASPALTASLQGTLGGGEGGWLPKLEFTGEARGDPAARLPFTLQAQGLGGAMRLDLAGSHDGRTGRGGADLKLRPFTPSKPGELVPALAGWFRDGSGTVGLKASFGWGKGAAPGKAELMLMEVALSGDTISLEGVNTVLTATSLRPLVMPPGQLLAIGALQAGIPLQNGQIGFGIDRSGVLSIDRADFTWAGGVVRAEPGRFALAEARRAVVLHAERLDLAQVLALAPVDGLQATGTLTGQLPVAFESGAFRLDQGTLAASGPGIIRYDPANPPAFLKSNGNAALLTQALANFHYTELSLTLDGAVGADMKASLHVKGKNPEFYDGYPVNLNLNISGALMSILRQGVGAYQLPDQVRERLEQFGRTP